MKIYISSTKADLADYRTALMAAIKDLGPDCVAIESYAADHRPPIEVVLQDVASCDLYVGIFAWRYGYIPENCEHSITELEYRKAIDQGIPTLIFLLDEDAHWPHKYVDRGEQQKRIEALRDELKQKHVVEFFNGPDDLRTKAKQAIAKQEIVIKSGGGTGDPPPKVSLLRLPRTWAAQFGRDQEMKRLDAAWKDGWKDGRTKTNIVTFVAFAGVGKSALIQSWLERLAKENFRGARIVFGWSFYNQEMDNQEASADVFMAEALKWFGGSHKLGSSPRENGQRLAELVCKERTILILDGLEVLQHTSGPQVGKLRDQSMQALLEDLAWQNPGLCIIATRLPIAEINGAVEEILLDHLTAEEGVRLLSSLGVHGTKEEMIEAVKEFDGHPLALTLLGSYLVEFYYGVVSRWREVNQPEPDQARRIMRSYERLLGQGPELDILQLLGLFNGPAHPGALNALRVAPVISGLTDSLLNLSRMRWNPAVFRLHRLKLVPHHAGCDG